MDFDRQATVSIQTFARACSLLSQMPSSVPWSEGQADLYSVGLRAIPDEVLMDVMTQAVMRYRSRPTVADLLELAAESLNGPRPTADDAWTEVERLLTTRGVYCRQDPDRPNVYREGQPLFSHPLISRAVERLGGWRTVCAADIDLPTLRARFEAAYNAAVASTSQAAQDSLARCFARPERAFAVRERRAARPFLRVSNG